MNYCSTYLNIIINQCINNNKKYQSIFYKIYYKCVFNVAYNYYNDIQKAEDLTQDIFLKVFVNLHKFTGVEHQQLTAWLRRLSKNFIIDNQRKRKIEYIGIDHDMNNFKDIEDTKQRFTDQQLFDAINELSDQYKKVINMYFFDNLTHIQIAKKLSIEEGTSKSNLFRAKAKIKKTLELCQNID